LTGVAVASAQETTSGSIAGSVKDVNGGVMPGATVHREFNFACLAAGHRDGGVGSLIGDRLRAAAVLGLVKRHDGAEPGGPALGDHPLQIEAHVARDRLGQRPAVRWALPSRSVGRPRPRGVVTRPGSALERAPRSTALLPSVRLREHVGLTALLLAVVTAASPSGAEPPVEKPSPAVTIAVDFVVENRAGRPITDLKEDEINVVQDSAKQAVASFERLERPGLYRLTYVPRSGKPGRVWLRVLRGGARVRGPEGPALKPRIIAARSPLETRLESLLESRPDADKLVLHVSVRRFEVSEGRVHHAVVVEVPLVQPHGAAPATLSRLQILARIEAADGTVENRLTFDRTVEGPATPASVLVWTGDVFLKPGRHTLDCLVVDPTTDRASVRHDVVDVAEPGAGLAMSSVTLLQPNSVPFVREGSASDPFFFEGQALTPRVDVRLPAGLDTALDFFVIVYPDRRRPEAPALRVELLHEGRVLGAAPVVLPPPDDKGEIRYVARVPTRTFRPIPYSLRLVSTQGTESVSEEASFVMVDPATQTPALKFGSPAPPP
jgi:hypothetical protein